MIEMGLQPKHRERLLARVIKRLLSGSREFSVLVSA